MKKILIIFCFILSYVFCSENDNSYKYEKKIISVLEQYLSNLDNKNPKGMLEHITIPLNLHFGSEKVVTIKSNKEFDTVFNNWKISNMSKFFSTKIKSIKVEPTLVVNNLYAVADVTYDRLNENGNVLRTERALYHFVKGNGYYSNPFKFIWTYLTRWISKWKIYMISNIEIDN